MLGSWDSNVGINNRKLETFKVSLETTGQLAPLEPDNEHVTWESGIRDRSETEQMGRLGIHAYLIGESLVCTPGAKAALQVLLAQD